MSLKEVTLISLTKRKLSGVLSKTNFQIKKKKKDTEGLSKLPDQIIKRISSNKMNSKQI